MILPITVRAETPLTAAFIRDQQLWIKKGNQETQLTKNRYIYAPQWSHDGRFIAYIDGDAQGNKSQLYIYDTKENEHFQPYVTVETSDVKWSPVNNQLAYTSQGILNVTKLKNGRPHGFENVSLGVSGFQWFPNGKEFIVSSQASLHPTGWGPISLYQIPVDANLAKEKMKLFYTIQTNDNDLFAIDADFFKFSFDGKWISFLATPTASWSMDSNSLCVISATGTKFQAIDHMLGYKNWFKWAPSANQLAYISGEGRFFVENKKSTIINMPIFNQQKQYTPNGYVDLDIEWFSPDTVIVARAKENKEWKEGPVPTMFTTLYEINVTTETQKPLTFPKQHEIDETPQVIDSYLTWFRKKEKSVHGDVWVREGLSGKSKRWIERIDEAPVFLK